LITDLVSKKFVCRNPWKPPRVRVRVGMLRNIVALARTWDRPELVLYMVGIIADWTRVPSMLNYPMDYTANEACKKHKAISENATTRNKYDTKLNVDNDLQTTRYCSD
jgi:hypothetical protein